TLVFEPLDEDAFPAVRLAREAGRCGGTAPAAYNAANEEAVTAFLSGRLPFRAVVDVVGGVIADLPVRELPSLAEVLDTEEEARRRARVLIEQGAA
ncbi:MAG TPA: 1-deoxy-D-xylulose-5-phosphate reductoisomerase, partial [Frankiaceae bacterium]|nr:1-deoxy-D-xylulose-5-phosphate reductoisomerase [Frankiaceae bacterium]